MIMDSKGNGSTRRKLGGKMVNHGLKEDMQCSVVSVMVCDKFGFRDVSANLCCRHDRTEDVGPGGE